MEDARAAGASSTPNSTDEAEAALRRLEELVRDLSCAEPARAALATLRQALEVAHFHAHTDALTGLMNRGCFLQALPPALARAERAHEHGALLFIDLDDFKLVNDDLGHAAGDEVLAVCAQRLREAVRDGDLSARYGGDEFVAYLENVAPETARAIAERVIAKMEQPCATSYGTRRVTPSVGIALYPQHGLHPAELLRHADSAMYMAKSTGGAACALHGESNALNKSSVSGAFYARIPNAKDEPASGSG